MESFDHKNWNPNNTAFVSEGNVSDSEWIQCLTTSKWEEQLLRDENLLVTFENIDLKHVRNDLSLLQVCNKSKLAFNYGTDSNFYDQTTPLIWIVLPVVASSLVVLICLIHVCKEQPVYNEL